MHKGVRAKKYADAILQGKTIPQAALAVNPDLTRQSSIVVGNRLEKSPIVQAIIKRALNKQNLTVEIALKKIADTMNAKRALVIRDRDAPTEVRWIADRSLQFQAAVKILQLHHAFDPPAEPTEPGRPTDITPLNQDNPELRRALLEAMRNGDIEAVERIVFKKETKEVSEPPQI